MDQETPQPNNELLELLRENLEVARENNKLLKRLHRNALLAFIAKVVLWLILLGVPLFFLGPYLGALFNFVKEGKSASPTPGSVLGVPSADELQQVIDVYTGNQK